MALANGEIGIVIARGRRANLPLVAALVSAGGTAYAQPLVRDVIDPRIDPQGTRGWWTWNARIA